MRCARRSCSPGGPCGPPSRTATATSPRRAPSPWWRIVAAVALGASQWLDYHSVSVGTDAYSGSVGVVAPPPEVETEIAGKAHAWVMMPLAVAALAALAFALLRRPRAAAPAGRRSASR